MNERIKELMKQSGAYDYYEVNEGVDGDEQPMIKFAELIVRECCQLIDDSTPVYSPNDLQEDYCKGKLDGYHAALLEIREHFGVKE